MPEGRAASPAPGEAVFGRLVPDVVRRWVPHAPPGRALDLGCAGGAVTHFLAERGYCALGLDRELPAMLPQHAGASFQVADVRCFALDRAWYQLIVALNVLQFMRRSERGALLESVTAALTEAGMVILESFTTEDPGYRRCREVGLDEVEPQTFFAPKLGGHLSFFRRGELNGWAESERLEVLHYVEQEVEDDHPPSGPHRHGLVTLVGRRVAGRDPAGA